MVLNVYHIGQSHLAIKSYNSSNFISSCEQVLYFYPVITNMPKYQVTIHFEITDEFMDLVPEHRTYINYLIIKGVIDHYAVSMETQRAWITFNAKDKKEVVKTLAKSPLHKFWTYEVDELYVLDGQHYRFPALQPN